MFFVLFEENKYVLVYVEIDPFFMFFLFEENKYVTFVGSYGWPPTDLVCLFVCLFHLSEFDLYFSEL